MKFISRFFKTVSLLLLLLFALPALVSVGVWKLDSRPSSWSNADWTSAGILPQASSDSDAVIYVMAARTGGLKGALALHSWLVTKKADAPGYSRHDKVGWGTPVRRNSYPADGRWYSNAPEILREVRGEAATRLIPRIEKAIQSYPYRERGDYKIWPGPNSNSFIAHVLNEVPELGIALPPNAVGRDYISGGRYVNIDPDWMNFQASYKGYAGFSLGRRNGFELNFMGLVAGFDIIRPAIKLPGFGRIGFAEIAHATGFAGQDQTLGTQASPVQRP